MDLGFVARKLIRLIVTLWVAVTFVFIVLRLSGDPVLALVPPDLPDSIIEEYRARLGLDRPMIEQYVVYIANVLQGEFGFSFRTSGPAADLVASRLGATLLLGGCALLFATAIGIPLGIIAAVKRNQPADRAIMAGAVFGFAMPNFFLGIILILIFTLTLQWLPSSGFESWWNLVMPVLTLGLASAGTFARFTRSSILEVLGQQYMQTARAKGISRHRALLVHALPNAAVPLVTLLGFTVGVMVAGAVVTETVFAWPGVGRLLVISVQERDLAVVQLIVILVALTMSLTNLAVDLTYSLIDPRIRVREAKP
jgi:peptide/nickel transport system permease protein